MNTVVIRTALLLTASNVFMTFAWYAHLRNLADRKWYVAAIVSWGIALFEYLLQVPANRIGYHAFTLPQLKILQEVITLSVFVPFAILYMRQQLRLDFLWAGLCLLARCTSCFADSPSDRSRQEKAQDEGEHRQHERQAVGAREPIEADSGAPGRCRA